MKQRILFILLSFIFSVVVFIFLKSIFILLHASIGGGVSITDFFAILKNGLPLDSSTSGYVTVVPALLAIASLWVRPSWIKSVLNIYWLIVSFLIGFTFIVDSAVYPYWGFHIDASIFLYLTSPKEALASATYVEMILGSFSFIFLSLAIYYTARKVFLSFIDRFGVLKGRKRAIACTVLVFVTALLFLPIRGSVTRSTMNVGRAYFSENMYFNHAAINPVFNLIYTVSKTEKFEKQYQFFKREKAETIFSDLIIHQPDSTIHVLNKERPNIILVMLESFSGFAAYDSLIAPNLVKLSQEGINFSNFYANSFRTDRGIVSILSGYPAHPTVSLMKYPMKTQSLPSIPKSLVRAGYNSSYYYGGDIDFASMRSYVVAACATNEIFEDKDFPAKIRMGSWGVADEHVFNRVFDDITREKYKEPFITTMLTLSSHEPFDVPVNVLDEPFYNSMYYTDMQIGKFIDRLKETELWQNTLVVFLADHGIQSHPAVPHYHELKHYIPMIWVGGVIEKPIEIADFGSQNNLAATLLGQLNIDYSDFLFSSNMLNSAELKHAFYTYRNGFFMQDSAGVIIYDNDKKEAIKQEGDNLEERGKAFFQKMYLDLGER